MRHFERIARTSDLVIVDEADGAQAALDDKPVLVETNELLHEIYAAIARCLHHEAQQNPELFDLRIDSEEARTARNIRV
jgi:hypothetical protein